MAVSESIKNIIYIGFGLISLANGVYAIWRIAEKEKIYPETITGCSCGIMSIVIFITLILFETVHYEQIRGNVVFITCLLLQYTGIRNIKRARK